MTSDDNDGDDDVVDDGCDGDDDDAGDNGGRYYNIYEHVCDVVSEGIAHNFSC